MAIAVVDDRMLREPRLLMPRMSPLCAVRVDETNPLAKGLVTVLHPKLIESPYKLILTPVGNPQILSAAKGLCYAGVGGSSDYWEINRTSFTTEDFSSVCHYFSSNLSTSQIVGIYESSGTDSNWNGLGGSVAGREIHFFQQATQPIMYSYTSGAQQWSYGPNGTANKDEVVGMAVRTPGAVQCYYDRSLYLEDAGTFWGLQTYHPPACIRLNQPGYLAANRGLVGGVYLQYIWNRCLSPAEMADIMSNPYQLLIPAA